MARLKSKGNPILCLMHVIDLCSTCSNCNFFFFFGLFGSIWCIGGEGGLLYGDGALLDGDEALLDADEADSRWRQSSLTVALLESKVKLLLSHVLKIFKNFMDQNRFVVWMDQI